MHGYIGTKGEVEFAWFLVANARLLVAMEVSHLVDWSKEDIDSQRKKICISGKASSELTFTFLRATTVAVREQWPPI